MYGRIRVSLLLKGDGGVMRYLTDVLSPASIWQDDNGTYWISMSEIEPTDILELEQVEKLIKVLTEVRDDLISRVGA